MEGIYCCCWSDRCRALSGRNPVAGYRRAVFACPAKLCTRTQAGPFDAPHNRWIMDIGKWEASVFEFSGLSTSAICNFVLPRCVFIVADIAAYLGIGLDRLGQQRGGQVLFGKGWSPGRRLAPGRDRRLCLRTTLFCLDGVGDGKRAVPGKSGRRAGYGTGGAGSG